MPRIIYLFGQEIGNEIRIDKAATLGRTASIKLDDASVSREHAKIEYRNGSYFLVDLKSRNGSFINGKKVEGEQRLAFGDEITLGKVSVRFAEDVKAVGPEEIMLGGDDVETAAPPVPVRVPQAAVPKSLASTAPGKKPIVMREEFAPKVAAQKTSLMQQDFSQYGGVYKFLILLAVIAVCVGAFYGFSFLSGKIAAPSQKIEQVEDK